MPKSDVLPANTFPVEALPRAASRRTAQDPLARFVADIAQHSAGTVTFNASHAASALMLAQRIPFDPNALVEEGQSLLTFVLRHTSAYASRRLERVWPATLEKFGPHLIEHFGPQGEESRDEVDNEWLGAVLLAAGADPWEGRGNVDGPHPVGVALGRPLFYALAHRMTGLVDVLMSKPGAPDFATVAATPVEKQVGGARALSWLHLCASDPKGAPLLGRFLSNGAEPHRLVKEEHALHNACPEAVAVYAHHNLLPVDASLRRSLESQWRERMHARDLTPESFAGMVALLKGQSPQERASAETEALLAREVSGEAWGDTNRSLGGHEGHSLTSDYLLTRGRIKKGAWAGQWSGWSAKMMRGLRASDFYGVRHWDFPRMLGEDFAQPARAGELQGALGFDWRPGISIDGVVMLSLLGQKMNNHSPATVAGVQAQWDKVEAVGSILGIADMRQWALDTAPAAVAFTEHLPAGSSGTAFMLMRTAWKLALYRQPDLLSGREDLELRLVRALHGNYTHALKYEDATKRRKVEGVLGEVFQALPSFPLMQSCFASVRPGALTDLDPHGRALAVELGLLLETPEWLTEIQRSVEWGELGAGELSQVQTWLKTREKQLKANDPNLKLDVAQILQMRALVLAHAWSDPALPSPSRPRM